MAFLALGFLRIEKGRLSSRQNCRSNKMDKSSIEGKKAQDTQLQRHSLTS
ncbi:hypothetical protein [Microcoleus sp. PH2017_22_RUC_O_B]|nr:hypothetical protein [Microcoleus sp. PH2017_22_RUC_O_B]